MTRTLLPFALVVLAACGGSAADGGSAGGIANTAPPTEVPSAETPSPASDPTIVEPAPAQTVVSADGVVFLDVPAGAVPPGTDITIEPTSAPEGVRAAYEFGPDGLQFAEPARLHWNVVLPDDATSALSLGVILDDGTTEQLGGAEGELSDDGLILSADVEHFTDLALVEWSGIRQIRPEGPVPVGQEFSFLVVRDTDEEFFEMAIALGFGAPEPLRPNPYSPAYYCEPVGVIQFPVLVSRFPTDTDDSTTAEVNQFGNVSTMPTGVFARLTLRAECIEPGFAGVLTIEPGGADPEFPGPVEMVVTGESFNVIFSAEAMALAKGGSIGVSMVGSEGDRYSDCYYDDREAPGKSFCVAYDGSGNLIGEATATLVVDDDDRGVLDIPPGLIIGEDGLYTVDFGSDPFVLGQFFVNLFDTNGQRFESRVALDQLGSLPEPFNDNDPDLD